VGQVSLLPRLGSALAKSNLPRLLVNDTHVLHYDLENRLKGLKASGVVTASFGYDGDGRMVTATVGVTTTYYVGNYFELVNGITHTYYYHGGKRIAMRDGSTLYWLLCDHLGSTSIVVAATSALTGELRYKAYGETRDGWGITTTTKYHFTGQREEGTIGLYFYNARWYDAALGRFVQADTVVPEPGNPQTLNRYSYVNNNPLKYVDPSGRAAAIDERADLLSHPVTRRPFLRSPAPSVIPYIYGQLIRNARSLTAALIRGANESAAAALATGHVGAAVIAKVSAQRTWASQVMDARIKDYVGPLAPLVGNWDHKPILYPKDPKQESPVPEIVQREGWSTVGSSLYRFDTWSNIHYGYVGRASGFSQLELTGGAGIEQIGSDLVSGKRPQRSPGADNWAASFDDPSDNAAIQIGITLWNRYALSVKPADVYLAVLEAPRLATRPLVGVP
jgi:RHS repeat-associated protein